MRKTKTGIQNITVLKSTDAVRKRPQMFIGDISSPLIINLLIQELLCIGLDKIGKGLASEVNIGFFDDGVFSVKDNGQPIGLADKFGEPLIQVLLTELHACRNIKSDSELCGAGIVVTNALSEFLTYECGDGKNHWQQNYQFGNPVNDLEIIGETTQVFEQFEFSPDKSFFPNSQINIEKLIGWLKSKMDGLKVEFEGNSIVIGK